MYSTRFDARRRRVLLNLGLGATLPAVGALPAWSAEKEPYPSRVIKLIVPFPPGGGNDTLGRLVAQRLSGALGQPVIVENHPGAGGNVGTELAARAAPDGYTLNLGFVANMCMTPSMAKVRYDPLKDFAPVSLIAQGYQVLAVNPKVPVKSVDELVALAKKEPHALNYASGGTGTPLHLVGELFKMATQTDIQHVPYQGSGRAATAVIAGEAEIIFGAVVSVLPFIQSGRLRPLAVTAPQRIPAVADLPTLSELGYKGIEASSWYGLYVPAATPEAIIQRLNAELVKAEADPAFIAQLERQGQQAMTSTPNELGAFTRAEYDKWSKVVKAAHITMES